MKTFKANLKHGQTLLMGVVVGAFLTGCLPAGEKGSTQESSVGGASSNPDYVSTPDPVVPTPVPPKLPTLPPPPQSEPDEGVIINGGALATKETELDLKLYKFEALKMKISKNANCVGGAWQDYSESAKVTLAPNEQNKTILISAQFSDFDARPSGCFAAAILHDNRGPNVLFTKYPLASIDEGTATQLIYEASDTGVGLAGVVCKLNGIEKPCSGGRTIVDIPGATPGVYTFAVSAVDNLGNSASSEISWEVTSVYRSITHDIHINEYRKWDILFVIDNSGSMEYEQQNMASRTRNFLSVLHGLDWQIAVTTTDPRNVKLGDGQFIELTGRKGEYLLNSSMNESDAQNILSQTLQRPEVGSGSEQPIRTTYRAIERSGTPGSVQSQFFRSGAHFAVVLISDEDESDNKMENDPQSLLNLVQSKFDGQKNFLFNSIITIPGDLACANTYGYSYGERFKVMTDLTGGVLGSVCATDYAAQMTGIAEKIRAMAKSFTLSCVPVAGTPVVVERDGVALADPFKLDGVSLSFDQAILPGDYRIKYSCLK